MATLQHIVFFLSSPCVHVFLFQEHKLLNKASRQVFSVILSLAILFQRARWPGVKMPLGEPLRPQVLRRAVVSCQLLLLYSLIVERSVSHPVRLTAGVPLVTPPCPLPTDAIVAEIAAEESRALQDVRQYWEGRGGNPGAVYRSPVGRVSLTAFPGDSSRLFPRGFLSSSHLCV